MNEKKLRLIHTVCGCVISAALIVAAVGLIVSAYTIYNLGDSPYTPESIGAEYDKIAVPLWVAIFAVIAGIVLNIALPMPKSKAKAIKDPFIKLRILQKKLSADCNHTGIARERQNRKIARIVCTLLCAVAFIPAIAVLCDYDSFTVDNLTPALLRVVGMLSLGAIISGVLLFVLSVIERRSAEQEIEWTKLAISECKKSDKISTKNDTENTKKIVRLILVGAACALIVVGLTQDGFYDVLQKAIRICTECIGLG
ncbi:MAG: tripartite tricarboxylate transporter TctB family protein [Clostridia bacterium]|nr:tripartite tricarboxylate transporter TctB family protein [Clostridia bacterium]